MWWTAFTVIRIRHGVIQWTWPQTNDGPHHVAACRTPAWIVDGSTKQSLTDRLTSRCHQSDVPTNPDQANNTGTSVRYCTHEWDMCDETKYQRKCEP